MNGRPINQIKRLRNLVGLSQRDLAERINHLATQTGERTSVTSDSVSRWERGGTPQPAHRRFLAAALDVRVEDLGLSITHNPPAEPDLDQFAEDVDPRVEHSRAQWVATRGRLNANRHALAQVAARLYPPAHRLGDTGLLAHPDWIPTAPVDLADVDLTPAAHADPDLDGTEPESAPVRPAQTLMRPYPRYTQAIRDLARPRLFEDRLSWRLTDVDWHGGKGRMGFGDTTYFAGVDVFEATAHELAYVATDDDGHIRQPAMRDLPYRRLIGDPFNLARRPVLPAISTLTIRAGDDGAEFLLHRRDPRSVTAAGGMLQVIPSGIFQPSSVLPGARAADFNLWRNLQREFSEELLGNAECDGHGRPVDYTAEPFASLDAARADGRLRVHVLGVALDALTLFGEVLTVAVFDAATFDALAGDFVDRNDEGQVVAERMPFTEEAIRDLLTGGRLAPAGAGCIELAWRHRGSLVPSCLEVRG